MPPKGPLSQANADRPRFCRNAAIDGLISIPADNYEEFVAEEIILRPHLLWKRAA